jgi:hypothetical protein
MNKFLAVFSSTALHLVFITGFTATGTAATHIAADRATYASWMA